MSAWKKARMVGVILLMLSSPSFSKAQGCSQCRDNTAANPVETQHAYRDAIIMLAGGALAVATAAILVGRRFR